MLKITNIQDEDLYMISGNLIDKKYKSYLNYKVIEVEEFDNNIFKEIYRYQLEGAITIIKYPEKIKRIKRYPGIINLFIDANCLFILDFKSLIGNNGLDSKRLAKKFVKLNIYNFMSTDDFDSDIIERELQNYLHLGDILSESYKKIIKDEIIHFIGIKLNYKRFFGVL